MVRRLSDGEKALWGRVIASVAPLHKARPKPAEKPVALSVSPPVKKTAPKLAKPLSSPLATPIKVPQPQPAAAKGGLDGSWDRRIDKGAIIPDVTVDLHGSGLSSAYARLDGALEQAIAHNMRVILLVTGKARSHDRTSGEGRGAIASVVRDWLAASRHGASIAAVRSAHPRHGGMGALYIMLRR